jgi:excinuclease UvrABC helicase subunit UvrB
MDVTAKRREKQSKFNEENGIIPATVAKKIEFIRW